MTQIMLPDDPLDGRYPTLPYFDLQLQGTDPGLGEWIPNFTVPFPPLTAPYGLQESSIPVSFGHGTPDPATGSVTFFAQSRIGDDGNLVPMPSAKVGSFEAHDVHVGDVRKWEVVNLTHGDHPFHTHGFFFELIEWEWLDMLNPSTNWVSEQLKNSIENSWRPRKLKDTIRAPARLGAKGSSKSITRLRVHFDDTGREGRIVAQGENPTIDASGNVISGGWLFHCHVLEHSAKGMLSFIEVRDPASTFVLLGKHKAGTTTPYLTGSGNVETGVRLDLVNAAPNTPVYLVHSNRLGNRPWSGGTLVPALDRDFAPGMTDAQGEASWTFGFGQVDEYWQVTYFEPSLQSWTLSNAVQALVDK